MMPIYDFVTVLNKEVLNFRDKAWSMAELAISILCRPY